MAEMTNSSDDFNNFRDTIIDFAMFVLRKYYGTSTNQ